MKRFGLIGRSLSHSFSANYFSKKFETEGLADHCYNLFELDEPVQLFSLLWKYPDLRGLNVTIPFKTSILPYLDELDETATRVNAANTVSIIRSREGLKLKGFNTDIWGFENSTDWLDDYKYALILGSGGAAKAVEYVLRKRNVDFLIVSRNPVSDSEISYRDLSRIIMEKYRMIINTTPLGMYPHTELSPEIPYNLLTSNHFLYDLIYNPDETIFLQKGNEVGARTMNGLKMLQLQAGKSWEIWNRT